MRTFLRCRRAKIFAKDYRRLTFNLNRLKVEELKFWIVILVLVASRALSLKLNADF